MGGNVPAVVHHGQKFETQAELAVTLFGPGVQELSLVDRTVQDMQNNLANPIQNQEFDPIFKLKSKLVDLTKLVKFWQKKVQVFLDDNRAEMVSTDDEIWKLWFDLKKFNLSFPFKFDKIKNKIDKLKMNANVEALEPLLASLERKFERHEDAAIESMRITRKAFFSRVLCYFDTPV